MGWSPQCYIPSYVKIGLPVPEKILEGILSNGRGSHLGHVSSIMSSDFHFLVQIGTVVSEKSKLKFCMYTTLGQGLEMTLTFNTHISSYIQLDVRFFLLHFRSLAAIISEKSTVFTFSYRKA